MISKNTYMDAIEHEAAKMEALNKVEASERIHSAYTHAVETFRRPAFYGTELQARDYEEQYDEK